MAACYMSSLVDYSIPLHVDCSVEYELPAHTKPPPGRTEPLLMIHPCHFRRLERQRWLEDERACARLEAKRARARLEAERARARVHEQLARLNQHLRQTPAPVACRPRAHPYGFAWYAAPAPARLDAS